MKKANTDTWLLICLARLVSSVLNSNMSVMIVTVFFGIILLLVLAAAVYGGYSMYQKNKARSTVTREPKKL